MSAVTSVESKEALVTQHLLGTIEAVLVHQFSYKGTGGALVLHTCLHQVDGIHSCGTGGYDINTHTEVSLSFFSTTNEK